MLADHPTSSQPASQRNRQAGRQAAVESERARKIGCQQHNQNSHLLQLRVNKGCSLGVAASGDLAASRPDNRRREISIPEEEQEAPASTSLERESGCLPAPPPHPQMFLSMVLTFGETEGGGRRDWGEDKEEKGAGGDPSDGGKRYK